MTVQADIKKGMESGTLTFGSRSVLRLVKTGKVKSVIYSENCKEDTLKDIEYFAKQFGIKTEKFEGNSRQLGELCAKPFNVMIIGINR